VLAAKHKRANMKNIVLAAIFTVALALNVWADGQSTRQALRGGNYKGSGEETRKKLEETQLGSHKGRNESGRPGSSENKESGHSQQSSSTSTSEERPKTFREILIEELELSSQQVSRLRAIGNEWRNAVQRIKGSKGFAELEHSEKKELLLEWRAYALERQRILSPEQFSQLKSLIAAIRSIRGMQRQPKTETTAAAPPKSEEGGEESKAAGYESEALEYEKKAHHFREKGNLKKMEIYMHLARIKRNAAKTGGKHVDWKRYHHLLKELEKSNGSKEEGKKGHKEEAKKGHREEAKKGHKEEAKKGHKEEGRKVNEKEHSKGPNLGINTSKEKRPTGPRGISNKKESGRPNQEEKQ